MVNSDDQAQQMLTGNIIRCNYIIFSWNVSDIYVPGNRGQKLRVVIVSGKRSPMSHKDQHIQYICNIDDTTPLTSNGWS